MKDKGIKSILRSMNNIDSVVKYGAYAILSKNNIKVVYFDFNNTEWRKELDNMKGLVLDFVLIKYPKNKTKEMQEAVNNVFEPAILLTDGIIIEVD